MSTGAAGGSVGSGPRCPASSEAPAAATSAAGGLDRLLTGERLVAGIFWVDLGRRHG